VNDPTDQQLLRDYAAHRSEAAFAELVRRHVNLVYSAALRMVCDAHLAQDVTQATFVALAQNATHLTDRAVLSGWLHRTAQNLAGKTVRTEVRRRAREQEAVAMNDLLSTGLDASWEHIAPHLDAALGELSEPDRDALLLRYFEKRSAAEIGSTLGISAEAAQKRVSRAVERLREFFAKHGVGVGAGGLVAAISANAVQAAPVGLAVTISAAALAGTAATASTLVAATTKTIAMTTLQKTLVTATVALLAGAGIYEARQAAQLRDQVQTLQQQQAPLEEQVRQLQQERENNTNRIAGLIEDLANSKKNTTELLRLRGEVGLMRTQLANLKSNSTTIEQPSLLTAMDYYRRADRHGSNHEFVAQFEDLCKAIELDPALANAYKDRATLYLNHLPKVQGGIESAVSDMTRYLELKPRDASIRHNRGLYLEQLGQFDAAISDYSIVIQGDLDFEGLLDGKNKLMALDYHYRGRIYHWRTKDYEKAVSDYTSALALDPQIEGVRRKRGECYDALGEKEKAQQDFAAEPRSK
jgi:RNA polymerase sigma factor (sigma-70 family)